MENILKKAIEIKTLEIPEDKIKKVDFAYLEKHGKEFFKFQDRILTKSKNGWISAKIPELETNKQPQENLKLIEIMEWCKNFKKYVDFELDKIKTEQKELKRIQGDMLETIKNYIDKKITKN